MNEQAKPNEQLTQALQAQLRDIHLPEAVSWWPMAIGWWILAFLIIAIFSWLIYKVRKKSQTNKYRKQARQELDAQYKEWENTANSSDYLHFANALLKRIVKHIDPSEAHSHKTGQAWIDTLNSFLDVPLAESVRHALTVANYQASPSADINNIHSLLCRWIEVHQPKTKHASLGDNNA